MGGIFVNCLVDSGRRHIGESLLLSIGLPQFRGSIALYWLRRRLCGLHSPRRKSQNRDVTSYDSIISHTDLLEEFAISCLTRVGSEVSLCEPGCHSIAEETSSSTYPSTDKSGSPMQRCIDLTAIVKEQYEMKVRQCAVPPISTASGCSRRGRESLNLETKD
jgi:hypothetical protein